MSQQPQESLPVHNLPQCLLRSLMVTHNTALTTLTPDLVLLLVLLLAPTNLHPPALGPSPPPRGRPRLPLMSVSQPLPRAFLREHPHRLQPTPPTPQKTLFPETRRSLRPPPP